MKKILLPACMFLVYFGCGRSDFNPVQPPAPRAGSSLIVNGFDNGVTAYVDSHGYRLARYYDFSPFDSLRIMFTGQRTEAGEMAVPLNVKIGPAYSVHGSLVDQTQDFSFVVDVHMLGKSQFAALSFFVDESSPPIVLSNLRVVGW